MMNVVHGDVLGILVVARTACGASNLFAVVLGPPVLEIALGVELAAFVVEGVRQFMADRRRRYRRSLGASSILASYKRRLQYAGGEVDVVYLRIVVRRPPSAA